MTKPTPETEAAVELAEVKWLQRKTMKDGLEARIRKRIKAEMESELRHADLEFASAAQHALDVGATKTALKAVSSKNPGTLDSYLALLAPIIDETEDEAVAIQPGALSIEWAAAEELHITLDPEQVTTDVDPDIAELWSGFYEVFIRPEDGAVFIDPIPGMPLIHGVTEWLRADPKHESEVAAWVTAHPQD